MNSHDFMAANISISASTNYSSLNEENVTAVQKKVKNFSQEEKGISHSLLIQEDKEAREFRALVLKKCVQEVNQ